MDWNSWRVTIGTVGVNSNGENGERMAMTKKLLTFLAAFGKFQVLMTSGIISLVDTWLINDELISMMLISEMLMSESEGRENIFR